MGTETSPKKTINRTPPQKRKLTRKQRARKKFWPAFRLIALAAVVAIIGSVVACKILRPFKLYNRESRETKQLANQIDSMKKENALLERKIKYLQTPEGAAQAARKLGYVKPGEVTLVLPSEAGK